MLSLCFFRFKAVSALHLGGFLFTFFVFIIVFMKSRVTVSYSILCWLISILILGSLSYLLSENPSNLSLVYYLMNYSLPVLYVFITDSIVRNLSFEKIISILKRMLSLVRLYLFIELLVRLFVLSSKYLLTRDYIGLYFNLKLSSFAYSDCNFLGLFILWIFCLTLYLYNLTKDKTFKKESRYLIFFGFTSMSRSVMLSILVVKYLMFLYRKYKKGHFVFLSANIIAVPFSIMLLYNFLLNDASFRSKIGIMQGLKRIYGYTLNNILFGFGYGVGEYMYSYIKGGYGHLHIALFLGQIGIVGIVFFILWLIRMNIAAKNNCTLIIFAFLLSGLSLSFADSSFFLCMAIIASLEYKRKRNPLLK